MHRVFIFMSNIGKSIKNIMLMGKHDLQNNYKQFAPDVLVLQICISVL